MPTMPPSMGLPPAFSLSFDSLTVVGALTVLVMLAALALLLWATRARDRLTYRLRCPTHGVEARIEVSTADDGSDDVRRCSLCTGRVACDKACLRLVA